MFSLSSNQWRIFWQVSLVCLLIFILIRLRKLHLRLNRYLTSTRIIIIISTFNTLSLLIYISILDLLVVFSNKFIIILFYFLWFGLKMRSFILAFWNLSCFKTIKLLLWILFFIYSYILFLCWLFWKLKFYTLFVSLTTLYLRDFLFDKIKFLGCVLLRTESTTIQRNMR